MPPSADSAVAPAAAGRADGLVTITLDGRLDGGAGIELLAALQSHIAAGATRIDIDLLGITDWTPEGARALRRGRRIARGLAEGLHYRTGPGAGHDALLEAFDDSADPEDGEAAAGDDTSATDAGETGNP